MKYRGIIFDIDGTLTATNQLIFDTFNHVAEKYLNKTFTDSEIMAMFGPPESVILEQLFSDKLKEASKDYYEYYKSNHSIAKAYPGIKELIMDIKSHPALLAVYTGKGRRSSMITLQEIGMAEHFDMIVTGDDVEEHKPSAEGILKFVNAFNLSKEEVLMIGDAVSDVEAAKSAGVDYASVLWDSYGAEKVKEINSDKIFHSVEELRKHIFNFK
ncbi:MAG: HAD-IA family hydrolase [Ignavibacteriaceae bacterium]